MHRKIAKIAAGSVRGAVAGLVVALVATATVTVSPPARGQGADPGAVRAALTVAEAGDRRAALAAAARLNDPLSQSLVAWAAWLNDPEPSDANGLAAFIDAHPGWPREGTLRVALEQALWDGRDAWTPQRLVDWFGRFAPRSTDGVLLYTDALAALGRRQDAAAVIADRWPDLYLSRDDQQRLISAWPDVIDQGALIARADALLWAGRSAEAAQLADRLPGDWQRLVEARIRLRARQPGVDGAVDAVPGALQAHPGLVYERVRWRRYHDFTDGAIELLARQPQDPPGARLWWRERHILARRLIEQRAYARAYDLVAAHGQSEGFPLAQAEWLAGWLALQYLNRPAAALDHFQRLYESVGTPISLGRGAYWTGRAFEAQGRMDDARRWYRIAAQHNTVFYGQLAADRLGIPAIVGLTPDPQDGGRAQALLDGDARLQAARLLAEVDRGPLADDFVGAVLDDAETAETLAEIGRFARRLNLPHMSVRAGKQAALDGVLLAEAAYPMVPIDTADPRVDPALVLGLMRQESEFRTTANSRAGALGMMQLMPATARQVAGELGLPHDLDRLVEDPAHNIRLGSAYLVKRLDNFDGSYILAAAAYNAGAGRVRGWLTEFGDPRSPQVDAIDWIERIPIYETRNYVQRVLEATQVYRLRLGARPEIGALTADLTRGRP